MSSNTTTQPANGPQPRAARTRSLKRDSVLDMGNNLFSALLGAVIAVLTLLFYDENLSKHFPTSRPEQVARIILISGILVLLFYFFIDWYDLHLMMHIDVDVTRFQVLAYTVSAVILGSMPAIALKGNSKFLAFLTIVYFPIAVFGRNRFIQTQNGTYEQGLADGAALTLYRLSKAFLLFLSVLLLVLVVSSLRGKSYPPWLIPTIIFACWFVAACVKLIRNLRFLQPRYDAAPKYLET